jgi:hypothetical protein
MRLAERLYTLALRMYPRAFREEHDEEMLATLAEARDAGEPRRHVREMASLLRGGSRQRWLRSTDGSFAATLRQGLAWGVLFCVVRQAGFAVCDVIHAFADEWGEPSRPALLLLGLGWIVTFCLLASGRRRWGLLTLTVVVCAIVFDPMRALLSFVSLDGSYSLSFALRQFPPVLLPLLAAWVWPSRGVRLPAWSWAPLLALAAIVPAVSTHSWLTLSWGFWGTRLFEIYVPYAALAAVAGVAVAVLLAASWSDPRWAVAAALVFSQLGARVLLSSLEGEGLAGSLPQVFLLWVVVPAAAIFMARRARSLSRT